ncbi:MAG: hypothetical protein GX547_04790 [Phycisphaerae bacterium]|jgi:hypothetical protein|nr:hypothetical protein [Phycisphaerae bacterium]
MRTQVYACLACLVAALFASPTEGLELKVTAKALDTRDSFPAVCGAAAYDS